MKISDLINEGPVDFVKSWGQNFTGNAAPTSDKPLRYSHRRVDPQGLPKDLVAQIKILQPQQKERLAHMLANNEI